MSHKFVAGGEVGETRSFSLLSLSENLEVEMIHVDKLNDNYATFIGFFHLLRSVARKKCFKSFP